MSNLKPGQIIKHQYFRDVACLINQILDFHNDTYVLAVTYVNQGTERSYMMVKETLKIEMRDLKEWQLCLNPDLKCIRNSEWRTLS
jgi:hypothetical protein